MQRNFKLLTNKYKKINKLINHKKIFIPGKLVPYD